MVYFLISKILIPQFYKLAVIGKFVLYTVLKVTKRQYSKNQVLIVYDNL